MPWLSQLLMDPVISMTAGILLMLLGISFIYKFYIAAVRGKILIWRGFLPFTLVSPLFTHFPPGKRSLIVYKEGTWVHIIMAPLFLVISILCFAAGADLTGLPGTPILNRVINGGKELGPSSIVFDKHFGYRFPIIARAGDKLYKLFTSAQIQEKESEKYSKSDEN